MEYRVKAPSYKCAMCGKKQVGYGNNAYPVINTPGSRVCDSCNVNEIIPARIGRAGFFTNLKIDIANMYK